MRNLFAALTLCLVSIQAVAQITIETICWNIESGGSEISTIAEQIKDAQGIDLWGLSEVHGSHAVTPLELAAEDGENANFESFLGNTGGGDRLLIIYNESRFELLDEFELSHINIENTGRAPLVVHLKEKETETEFYFMVNHLFRGKASKRHQQSRLLNAWAEETDIPVIATGDYNYDWEVIDGDNDHDIGYDLLTAGGIFNWVRPQEIKRTQCSATRSGGCTYNSVLDFIFTANLPQNWEATSTILEFPGDFPDDSATSDHRQVKATFTIGEDVNPDKLKKQIRQQIVTMEKELSDLKKLLALYFEATDNE